MKTNLIPIEYEAG